jgi:hypothetical protein
MITQSEVYRLFERLDRVPGIMEPRLGRWRAWPIAKMQLVWHLMYEGADASVRGESLTFGKLKKRLSNYLSDLSVSAKQAGRMRRTGTIGMMYVPRIHHFADGTARDMIYGDLLQGYGLSLPAVALEQPLPLSSDRQRLPDAPIYLRPYQSAAELMALMLMSTRRLRAVAEGLDAVLADADIPLAPELRRSKVLLALSLFEARRRIFRRVLNKLGLRVLVVTYAPGRAGEIAAARELSIPVFELQHGLIGAHCPDYAWPAGYRVFKSDMALPDRIGLFGPMFAREIVRSGFWTETETPAIGAASMESYRPAQVSHRQDGRLRLVYMTQATNRVAAVAFWQAYLSSADGARECELVLKLHPEEVNDAHAYEALVRAAPDVVTIVPANKNPMDAMLNADVVLSYNSLALIESLGLGTPSISLCGGSIPGGFAGTLDLRGVMTVMPHVNSPAQLRAVLLERAGNDAALTQWRDQALNYSRDCFTAGFTKAATGIINAMAGADPQYHHCTSRVVTHSPLHQG